MDSKNDPIKNQDGRPGAMLGGWWQDPDTMKLFLFIICGVLSGRNMNIEIRIGLWVTLQEPTVVRPLGTSNIRFSTRLTDSFKIRLHVII